MSVRRRNTDEQLRRLEREASRGDPHALDRLRAARLRSTGIVPESHRIGMAVTGVFTPSGAVLCLGCDGRHPQTPAVHEEATAQARCDACGVSLYLDRTDVALLQQLRDELRLVHGVDMSIWQTGGMCAALGRESSGAEILVAVEHEGHSFVAHEGRILADRSYDQPPEHTYQQFGFPPGAQWGSVGTGMLEWHIGATDQDGNEFADPPNAVFRTRLVGEAAHLIARYLRRHHIAENPPRSHFLDSVESAIAWALENVGDAREDYPKGSSSRAEAVRQHQEEEVAEYVAEYAKVMRAGLAPVWRAVEIPKGENPRLWIDWDELGTHWSFRRSGAGVYSGGKVQGPTETVVIEAKVMAEDIDWEYGFTSFWYYGTEQFECALKEGATVEVTKVSGKPEADLKARANPGQRNVHYLVVISKGPLVIVRVPWPMPKWSSIMAAVTIVMREHELKQKDVTSIEAVGYMRGIDEQDLWTEDDHQAADRLDAAFAGDKTKYGPFWLYDWRDGSAEAEAKLKAARRQADALRRRIEVLKTDASGRFELVRKPTKS